MNYYKLFVTILGIAYMIAGGYIIHLQLLDKPVYNYVFGIGCILYGCFRIWREHWYRKSKDEVVEE